jgi:hypothetical protein
MNCFEALQEQINECEPCRLNSFILDFDELPEHEKPNFDYYEKDKHLIIYCQPCNLYKLL